MNQQSEIDIKIREAFNKMATIEDLHNLLTQVNDLVFNGSLKIQSIKSLIFFTTPSLSKTKYRTFTIKKKSGGTRTINAPTGGLKSFQKALNTILQIISETHVAATGFKPESSIVDNAKPHISQNYVFNIDLKDFFSSIDQARFWKRLQFEPFNLNAQTNRIQLANRIAALCFTEMQVERKNEAEQWITLTRNVLPQGAPTSPLISNIIAYRLDYLLSGLAKRFGLQYTRYADDITFSSKHNVYQKDSEFFKELNRLIKDQNFAINPSKTRLQKKGYRQETTGLTVNEKINLNSRYIKQLRMWLYYWEKYGLSKASELFKTDYIRDKGYRNKTSANFVNVLDGKLQYLKMVKGKEDPTYLKLHKRFTKLCSPGSDLAKILTVWETKGIDAAITVFNEKNHGYES